MSFEGSIRNMRALRDCIMTTENHEVLAVYLYELSLKSDKGQILDEDIAKLYKELTIAIKGEVTEKLALRTKKKGELVPPLRKIVDRLDDAISRGEDYIAWVPK